MVLNNQFLAAGAFTSYNSTSFIASTSGRMSASSFFGLLFYGFNALRGFERLCIEKVPDEITISSQISSILILGPYRLMAMMIRS